MDKKKFFLIGLAIISFFWFQSLAFCQESLGLSDLQHSLKMRGARWVAGENSLTHLSPAEQQKRLGLILPFHTGKEPMLSLEAQTPLFELPTGLDWRNNGGNFVTPVRNQGSCGSCWAFGATAALESNVLISNRTPGVDLNLSEQVMVSCGGAGSCAGGWPGSASEFIKNTGLPAESCYPYTATDGSCSSACPERLSSSYRISSYQYVNTSQPTLEGIKSALYNYGPLVTTMSVYQDFYSYRSGVYHYVTGSYLGGHAILIVGYDDVGQYFIAKNSWGTYWGESGFFRIAYSELNSVVGFGAWSIAYVGNAPACSYIASQPSPNSFSASGGNGSVSVTTASNCPWTATSDSWITITSGASGTGSGNVSFLVSANTGTSRTGTLKVQGQTLSITQAAGSAPCTYSINPAQQPLDASGGTGSLGVSAGSGCAWTAKSNVPTWITITAGSSGSGSGTVVYSVAANSSTSPRVGTMTIMDKTFTVTQTGKSCNYSISPTSNGFGATGGTGVANVSSLSGCAWTAVSNDAWIVINSGFNGSGSGAVGYRVAANSGTTPRSGTMTIAGQAFTVTQAGINGTPSIRVSPTSIYFGYVKVSGTSSRTVTVTNTGSESLAITSMQIIGSQKAPFSAASSCTTVAPGASCTITVTFAPKEKNGKRANLIIYSNDPVKKSVGVQLYGYGY